MSKIFTINEQKPLDHSPSGPATPTPYKINAHWLTGLTAKLPSQKTHSKCTLLFDLRPAISPHEVTVLSDAILTSAEPSTVAVCPWDTAPLLWRLHDGILGLLNNVFVIMINIVILYSKYRTTKRHNSTRIAFWQNKENLVRNSPRIKK